MDSLLPLVVGFNNWSIKLMSYVNLSTSRTSRPKKPSELTNGRKNWDADAVVVETYDRISTVFCPN
ncbi:hypothetical protein HNV11_17100 [Spirosoma taeanense]|uniref:Uncharacterized protein n=1 Tax=Spirosoma taeanense TaxID=2735870 RepID=A0A6M5YCM2_9BACT|nr:hypothetical protein [Spirosoma taeanense]QJW90971.1 hypothetical protein HNV11_17100 [Spirosoma taeanense]